MKLTFEPESGGHPIDLNLSGSGSIFQATTSAGTVHIEVVSAQDGRLEFAVEGQRVIAYVSSNKKEYWVTVDGQTFLLTKSSGERRGAHAHHAAGELTAPMPGQVRAVNVAVGDAVHKGQTLMLLEAMKMEIRVQSPQEGRVKAVHVRQGQTVEREQLLVEVE